MLNKLPIEIQVELLTLDPNSCLKFVNSHFYMLYNDMYYKKIINTFGKDIVGVILKVLPWLQTYIKTLDVFRGDARKIISSRLNLPYDIDDNSHRAKCEVPGVYDEANGNLNVAYVKDSWKYIYSLLKNKRMFAEYSDYKIDEPTNYVYNHFVEINKTYLLSYRKTLWLSPGTYNLNIGLVIKHGNGLGTTKFEVKYENEYNEIITQTFYPPANINEIMPKKQFCLLRLGEFTIPEIKQPMVNPDPVPAAVPEEDGEDLSFESSSNFINHLRRRNLNSLSTIRMDEPANTMSGTNLTGLNSSSGLANMVYSSNNLAGLRRNPGIGQSHNNLAAGNRANSGLTLNQLYNSANATSNSNSNLNTFLHGVNSNSNLSGFYLDNEHPSRSTSLHTILSNTSVSSMNTNNTAISNYNGLSTHPNNHHPKLVKVQLIMEEIGLLLKSGFRIFFIDVAQPTALFNEFDLLYYSVRETDYRYFINIPLKNFYKALNFVQNGGNLDDLSVQKSCKQYGYGDPYDIMDQYDTSFMVDPIHNKTGRFEMTNIDDEALMRYAEFYFNQSFIRRYFKFNTVYQRRQFVNRYGDFEIDWKKGENENYNSGDKVDSYSHSESTNNIIGPDDHRACVYDLYGLKWKMLPLGQL